MKIDRNEFIQEMLLRENIRKNKKNALAILPKNNSEMVMSLDGEPDGPHTSVEWQVWAYSTAAPEFIAEGAAVYLSLIHI